jgi:hypothetical protein
MAIPETDEHTKGGGAATKLRVGMEKESFGDSN